jgi:hypothetical protein
MRVRMRIYNLDNRRIGSRTGICFGKMGFADKGFPVVFMLELGDLLIL